MAKARQQASQRLSDSNISSYKRLISKIDLLTHEEEKELSSKIHAQRIDVWRQLLSYRTFVDGITGRLASMMEEDKICPPSDSLGLARTSANNFRARETKVNREAYESSSESLANILGKIDVDNKYSSEIFADLEAIESGRKSDVRIVVPPIPGSSIPFSDYMKRVRVARTALKRTRDKFITANLRLVVMVTRRYVTSLIPMSDLVQEGNIGLMRAVDRFEGHRGFRFSTYATWWIRHAVNRALSNKARVIRLPVHVENDLNRMKRAVAELKMRNGCEPSFEEIIEETGLGEPRLKNLLQISTVMVPTTNASVFGEMTQVLEDPDSLEFENDIDKKLVSGIIDLGLEGIVGEREWMILTQRFGLMDHEELTLKEIGEHVSLSRERIRQLESRALKKLRREFTARGIHGS
jgi:RNA polymerase primary sigma factor